VVNYSNNVVNQAVSWWFRRWLLSC